MILNFSNQPVTTGLLAIENSSIQKHKAKIYCIDIGHTQVGKVKLDKNSENHISSKNGWKFFYFFCSIDKNVKTICSVQKNKTNWVNSVNFTKYQKIIFIEYFTRPLP